MAKKTTKPVKSGSKAAASSARTKASASAKASAGAQSSASARGVRTGAGSAPSPPAGLSLAGRLDMANVAAARELFWNNIIREILTSLSVLSARIGARRPSPTTAAAAPKTLAAESGGVGSVFDDEDDDDDLENSGGPVLTSITSMADSASDADKGEGQDQRTLATRPSGPEALFDGRLAVITTLGQRIPIAEVSPVFACGVPGPGGKHWLSTAIECTVFEIRTPAGEVFTLPVHEIRAFHSLTDELMQKLVESSREEAGEKAQEAPFGFAAFTSLARGSEGSGEPEHTYEPGYFGE